MPHTFKSKAVTIGLVLLAIAGSGCEGENQTFGAADHQAGAHVEQQADKLHSVDAADVATMRTEGAAAPAEDVSATKPVANQVSIDNFTFSPQTLTVSVGASVTWLNRDDVPHSVVSTDKLFKSPPLDTDDKFSFTFTKPGEYPYFCGVHPHMTGKIVVK